MRLNEWRRETLFAAKTLGLGSEYQKMFEMHDPFHIFEAADIAFRDGVEPIAFVVETFGTQVEEARDDREQRQFMDDLLMDSLSDDEQLPPPVLYPTIDPEDCWDYDDNSDQHEDWKDYHSYYQ